MLIRDATAARRAALQMLDAVRGGATLQGARDGALANLMERDRRLAYELAAGVLRRRAQLDGVLELASADPAFTTSSGSEPTSCARSRGSRRTPRYRPAWSWRGDGWRGRSALRQSSPTQARKAQERERGAVPSHPHWLLARWRAHFGADETARLIAWNDSKPLLTLQPARWSLDQLRARLTEAGHGYEKRP